MIDDPYAVLGVSRNATQDEIKKAYRQKTKLYHPDLHPNDPVANKKMTEINEAYDMLMNPGKYEARRAQQQREQEARQRQQNTGYGGYGGYGGFGGFGGYGGYGGSQNSGNGGNQNQQQSDWGGFGGFGGFDFGDIFGFGGQSSASSHRPQAQNGDSPMVQNAISAINRGSYQEAVNLLVSIPSTGRNARWYYLSSLANKGLDNTILATEQMQKAVQMDPNNRLYHQLLQQLRNAGQTYERNARGFDMRAMNMQKICFGLCMARMCCRC